jgi:hypothetical protein
MKAQTERLLAHLRIAPITPLEALKYLGSLRCGARIHDLRQQGHKIRTERVAVSNSRGEIKYVARYHLEKEA